MDNRPVPSVNSVTVLTVLLTMDANYSPSDPYGNNALTHLPDCVQALLSTLVCVAYGNEAICDLIAQHMDLR